MRRITIHTIRRFHEELTYNPETGEIRRKKTGELAGLPQPSSKNYGHISIDNRKFTTHRIAYAMYHGYMNEDLVVDHINGDVTNNRISNLRLIPMITNCQNVADKPYKHGSTGYLGVSKRGNKYRAQIWVNGTNRDLGRFNTPEEAHSKYIEAKRELHGGFIGR